MALLPTSLSGPSLAGTTPLAEVHQSSSPARETTSAPTLEVPLGQVTARPASRTGAESPSFAAGFLRPAVFGVVLAISVGAAGSAMAQSVRGAPLQSATIATQTVQKDAIDRAVERVLAADTNGDRIVWGGRWQNETHSLDPLAKAIYDWVDQVNPRGNYSLWGGSSRGDYQEGGLGLGFTTRPKHMTSNGVIRSEDLDQGVRELRRALASPRSDLVGEDLAAISARVKAETGKAPSADSLANAADHLLDLIKTTIEAKERATGREVVQLSTDELLAKLEPGALERTIAELTAGHGKTFYARELQTIDANRRAWGTAVHDEGAIVGDAQQSYLLQIAKAAKEESILVRIRAKLAK